MQRIKSREELLAQPYLSRVEVKRLFNISLPYANRLFDMAKAVDEQELGEYLLYKSKVRTISVLRVQHMQFSTLARKVLGGKEKGASEDAPEKPQPRGTPIITRKGI